MICISLPEESAGVADGITYLWDDKDDTAALDRFAASIGIKPEWCSIQPSILWSSCYCYPLFPWKRSLALDNGAYETSMIEWFRRYLKTEK